MNTGVNVMLNKDYDWYLMMSAWEMGVLFAHMAPSAKIMLILLRVTTVPVKSHDCSQQPLWPNRTCSEIGSFSSKSAGTC